MLLRQILSQAPDDHHIIGTKTWILWADFSAVNALAIATGAIFKDGI